MPRDDHIAKLIVREIHEQSSHSGREYVLAVIRERFWIVGARTLGKRVLHDCVVCRRIRGTPCIQKMADLPSDRVCPGLLPPFTHVGVDCFGPFLVKRGRSYEKRYGCIFTCLVVRAVHLEKLVSLGEDSSVNALVRFVARRGCPQRMRSDNGANFVAAEREIREAVTNWNSSSQVQEAMKVRGIEWQFNPPAASHMGGVWERQIRTVRKALKAILREQVLDDERLDTVFCEAERIVNGRPLTMVSDNHGDPESLTPNHLLLLRSSEDIVPGKYRYTNVDMYARRWRHV